MSFLIKSEHAILINLFTLIINKLYLNFNKM